MMKHKQLRDEEILEHLNSIGYLLEGYFSDNEIDLVNAMSLLATYLDHFLLVGLDGDKEAGIAFLENFKISVERWPRGA